MLNLEQAIQIFGIIQFIVIGLSHIFAPKVWAEFFIMLRNKGHAGVFVVGFISLTFGAIVVSFHNIWSGIPVVLTVVGWGQLIKAFIYFTFPQFGMKSLARVSVERAHRLFVWPGIVFLLLAAMLLYHIAA
ncbi:MAG: hypothetical protein H7246_12330 [Phycisphaerae bacterium]|nr:hypothetical protein [Saprospiraceae bacterium]